MLLDNFIETSEYNADNNVQDSIKQNLSDIIDTRNHSMNNSLPFCFGSIDTTDKSCFSMSDSETISNKMKESITKFENRLSGIKISLLTDIYGKTIIEISGKYKNDNGEISHLSFIKAC